MGNHLSIWGIVARSLIFLAIGAALSIAVAWWGAIRYDGYRPTIRFDTADRRTADDRVEWHLNINTWRGTTYVHSEAYEPAHWFDDLQQVPHAQSPDEILPRWAAWARPWGGGDRPANPTGELRVVVAHGWPLRTMCYRRFDSADGRREVHECWTILTPAWLRGPDIIAGTRGTAALPLRPILPELIGSAMAYGWSLWLVVMLISGARRAWRRRRGRCTGCGYDLRGSRADSPRCPECGMPCAP